MTRHMAGSHNKQNHMTDMKHDMNKPNCDRLQTTLNKLHCSLMDFTQ